ncbi:MAG: tRNA uridine-5-carboxymethylaminomethyl(34) synthesis GTPase MnmE [Bacteroidales bacterium]
MEYSNTNICALATPQGTGAIGIIRLSGKDTIDIVDSVFVPVFKENKPTPIKLKVTPSYKMRFGSIFKNEALLDEVLVTVFRAPHSYTGENAVEIYCHGSNYIINEILKLLLSKGIKMAEPGEFSKRAFLNGKLDLAQAEAVADLISSETLASHRVAIQQMKGGFSTELKDMRSALLNLVSLMELELDFSEEDVEFADRTQLFKLLNEVSGKVEKLIESFSLGNVIKNGVPVAIIGATNTGKSTLLNILLGEEKAIVSNIHGTTRDVIEDTINFGGIVFRFIDTAGIRDTKETIEIIGIERTYLKLKQASVVIMVLDATRPEYFDDSLINLSNRLNKNKQKLVILLNKADILTQNINDFNVCVSNKKDGISNKNNSFNAQIHSIEALCKQTGLSPIATLPVSAKLGLGIDVLKDLLINSQKELNIEPNVTLVTNIRHYQALLDAQDALDRVEDGLKQQIPTDLVTQDIREALYHLGSIVGEINTEEILGNIFGKFCIGK